MSARRPDPAGLVGPSPFAAHWRLDPGVTLLNHGSYGAAPSAVLDVQDALRRRLESEPVRFMVRELPALLAEARARLGALVGADPDDLAFVPNATTGVNTVLAALDLEPGDELLTTDHAYNACVNALRRVAERSRARIVVARVPFPLSSPEQVVEAVLAAATPRTRFAMIDHITSPTGLVWPVEPIVARLEARGVRVLVDGAHALGMVPLDLAALGASFYTANAHKWLCTPKGSAFLHVRRDRQVGIRPLVISHGANDPRTDRSLFRREFDWTGTQDPTAWLAIPAAIDFLSGLLPGGLAALMERNRALALAARDVVCAALDVPAPAPPEMIGSLAAVPVPARLVRAMRPGEREPLHEELFVRYSIEVPVSPWPTQDARVLRVAAQAYNDLDQYRALADALASLR